MKLKKNKKKTPSLKFNLDFVILRQKEELKTAKTEAVLITVLKCLQLH